MSSRGVRAQQHVASNGHQCHTISKHSACREWRSPCRSPRSLFSRWLQYPTARGTHLPGSRCRSEILGGTPCPRRRPYKPLHSCPLRFDFLFRWLLASGANSVGMHAHTGGVQELSSSTGDASRVEQVVVVGTVNIAEDAFDTALVVAQVMRGEQIRGTAGEAVGGGWRGRQVGLGEVEPGGAPASHVFVKSSSTHEHKGSGSIRRSDESSPSRCRQHEQCGVG